MRAIRRFLRRFFTVKPYPVPLEVQRRLRAHRLERACRMNAYAATWSRLWEEQRVQRDAEAKARRSSYTVVPK